jgi:hypothetical protein
VGKSNRNYSKFQRQTGYCGNAAIATRLFKDIFRDFKAFLKISILFEDISEKLKLFKNIYSGIEALLKLCKAFVKNSRLF